MTFRLENEKKISEGNFRCKVSSKRLGGTKNNSNKIIIVCCWDDNNNNNNNNIVLPHTNEGLILTSSCMGINNFVFLFNKNSITLFWDKKILHCKTKPTIYLLIKFIY
jgi:hypothetical protein